jgi:hypothetical protein
VELKTFLPDFAKALRPVDAARPQHITKNRISKKERAYQAGIGPHPEDKAVKLIVDKMRELHAGLYDTAQV